MLYAAHAVRYLYCKEYIHAGDSQLLMRLNIPGDTKYLTQAELLQQIELRPATDSGSTATAIRKTPLILLTPCQVE